MFILCLFVFHSVNIITTGSPYETFRNPGDTCKNFKCLQKIERMPKKLYLNHAKVLGHPTNGPYPNNVWRSPFNPYYPHKATFGQNIGCANENGCYYVETNGGPEVYQSDNDKGTQDESTIAHSG